jgi:hypothetical protein
METVSETSEGKLWPANVPAEAEATRMLLGEVPAGEFQSVVDSFRASLGPVEKGVLDLRSNQVLVTALAVKWRLTAAIAVAPVKRSEVDMTAVGALVQESQDAVLGLTGGVGAVTDFNLKQIFESTKRALQFLSGKLQKAVPAEAAAAPPPPAPEPVAAAPEPAAAPPARPVEPPLVPPPAPAPAPTAIAAAAASTGSNRMLLIGLAVVALIAIVWHGMNYMRDQADAKARQEREAKLPTEYSSGKVTQITLLKPDAKKVAEIEARAQAEGKRLIKISDTEYQLVADENTPKGEAPAPPTPEEKKPEEPKPEEGKAPEPTPTPAPEKKEAEGAKP